MKYLLDTNHVGKLIEVLDPPSAHRRALLRRRYALLEERFRLLGLSSVGSCSMVLGELLWGAENGTRHVETRRAIEGFWKQIDSVSFDDDAAREFGRIKALMRVNIGERDLIIAAIALANDLTVVTTNLRHFRAVPGLACETWIPDESSA